MPRLPPVTKATRPSRRKVESVTGPFRSTAARLSTAPLDLAESQVLRHVRGSPDAVDRLKWPDRERYNRLNPAGRHGQT